MPQLVRDGLIVAGGDDGSPRLGFIKLPPGCRSLRYRGTLAQTGWFGRVGSVVSIVRVMEFQAKRCRLVLAWRVADPAAGYANEALKEAVFPSEFPPEADWWDRLAPVRVSWSRSWATLAVRPGRTVRVIIDGLGLYRLTAHQSVGLYETILNRHWYPGFVIIGNRAVDEWLSLFDDPILCNRALDRLANASYQIVIEGTSYRERLSTHRALLSNQGGD